jgi:hypothetical protein
MVAAPDDAAFQVLEHQIVGAFVLSNVVQNADVRMRQLRDGASFTLEALTQFRITGKMFG